LKGGALVTGRELIIYIMTHGLEDEPVFKDGKLLGFLTVEEVAVRMNVGVATVNAWLLQQRLYYIRIDNKIYIPADFKVKGDAVNG
jgi:predicted transcriptional regulator